MGELSDEIRYMISLLSSDTIYIVDYFQKTPEGIKFMECDKEVFIPRGELSDIEKHVVKRSSILSEIF